MWTAVRATAVYFFDGLIDTLAQRHFDVFAKVVKDFLVVEIRKLMFLSPGLRIPNRSQ
jgi:hypothetical protein